MKSNIRKFLWSFLIILTVALIGFAQTETDARATVENFYKFYRTRTGILSTHELNLLKRFFTAELTAGFRYEIKREDEFTRRNPNDKPFFGDGLPFNPLNECYVDGKLVLNTIEIGKVEFTENKAIVEVKFFVPKECEDQINEKLIDTYRVELLKNKNRWLINDWIFDENERLSKILKREKY